MMKDSLVHEEQDTRQTNKTIDMRASLLWLCMFITACWAVWDDDAFKVDWQLPQIGRIQTVLASTPDRFHVVTDANILAGLYLGEVEWRVVLEGKSRALSYGDDILVVVNGASGSVVSVWAQDGFLVSELASFELPIADFAIRSEEIILILGDGKVLSLDSNGVQKPLGAVNATGATIHVFDNNHFIIHTLNGEQASYIFYNGFELISGDIKLAASDIRERFGSKIVVEKRGLFTVYQINQKTGQFTSNTLPSLEKFIPVNTGDFVAFEKNHGIEVYTVECEPQFTIPNVFRYDFRYVDDVFILYTEFHANIIDADTGAEIVSHPLGTTKLPFSKIQAIHTTTDGIDRINTLLQYTTGELKLMRNSNTHWERDYSLSDVAAHAIVDFEVETALTSADLVYEENLSFIDAYLFRLKRHFYELKDLYNHFWEVIPLYTTGEWEFPAVNNDRYFGFEKLLVLASRNGQISAINTLNGKKVWSFETEQSDIVKLENFSNEHLYVFTKSGPLFILNPKTGDLVVKRQLVAPSTLVRLDENSLLVETEDGFDVVIGDHTNESFAIIHDSQSVRGFKVLEKNAQRTWSFEPDYNETIVAYSTKDSAEPVANVGIVLGNRDVLYKYLYPNLASVAVWNEQTKALYVNIIDTLTGQVLHSAMHDSDVRGDSVSMVFGEYWVVYTYYSNAPTPEQRVVVIDLFESLAPNSRISTDEVSSFEKRIAPAVNTKSFIIPYKVDTLALTKSRFGVTTKAVIFGLSNGQVLLVPKFVLNSRRVVGRALTADEKAEFMMLPYDPVLSADDDSVISHKRQVLSPKHIVTVATNLESTSIVCTFGLDVFCTRVSPSTQFDKLTASFDKTKLLLSIGLMTFLVYFLRPMKESKILKSLWVIEQTS